MPHPRRVRRLPLILAFAALLAACEEDPLSPVSGFVPSDCIEPGRCSEGGMRLDGGSTTIEPDSGDPVGEMDASDPIADAGDDTDSGAMEVDAAEIDAGTVDTGPPPTNFLDVSG